MIDNGKMIINGKNGKANILMSQVEFDLDQFDMKNIIESLFDRFTDIQKENTIRHLTERRNENAE